MLQVLIGILGGIIASKKGRNPFFWALICFIFPLSILAIGIMPPMLKRGATKQCPYCKKAIRGSATECSSCGKGMPINLVKCEECGSFVPEGDYCMQCRKKLKG